MGGITDQWVIGERASNPTIVKLVAKPSEQAKGSFRSGGDWVATIEAKRDDGMLKRVDFEEGELDRILRELAMCMVPKARAALAAEIVAELGDLDLVAFLVEMFRRRADH